jgi:hypothetical protein
MNAGVYFQTPLVDVTRNGDLMPSQLKSHTKATDSGEEIDDNTGREQCSHRPGQQYGYRVAYLFTLFSFSPAKTDTIRKRLQPSRFADR